MTTITKLNSPTKVMVALMVVVSAFSVAARAAEQPTPVSPVTVTFVEPQKFTDVKEDWSSDSVANDQYRDFVLSELKAYLQKMAAPYFSEGRKLEVKITDIDLAGDFEPWRGHGFDDVRIVKDLYPPRMTVEFAVVGADGRVMREGSRKLMDMSFLMTTSMPSHDTLRYEKEMLRSWLRQEFKPVAPKA